MEYLTTYGWAVLVIAVVVVVLLKSGAFGGAPAQNACIAISGFSCGSTALSSNGLLTVLFGEVGQTITLTGVACTKNSTLTGGSGGITGVTSVSLSSTQKTPLSFPCPISNASLGTKFNGFLWVQYTVGGRSVLQRVGEVSASVTSIGTGLTFVHSLSFKVANSQSLATGSPFQQMVSFNPSNSLYSYAEAADLGNIRFYSGSTELYSWCESGCTSGASNAIFWVNMPSGISANSNVVLTAGMLANTVDYDGVYAGESPLLSVTGYTQTSTPIAFSANGAVTSGTTIDVNTVTVGSPTLWLCGFAESSPNGNDDISTSYSGDQQDNDFDGTAIGHQSSNGCTTTDDSGTNPFAGVAIGVANKTIPFVLISSGDGGSPPGTITVTPTGTSFVVIIVACDGGGRLHGAGACDASSGGSITGIPAGCVQRSLQDSDDEETAALFTCNALASGSYTIYANNGGDADISMAAYMFQNVTQIPLGYARYDNGGSVFDLYDNFNGNTLNSGIWAGQSVSGCLSVGNGITFTYSGGNCYIYTGPSYSIAGNGAIDVALPSSTNINDQLGFGSTVGPLSQGWAFKPDYVGSINPGGAIWYIDSSGSGHMLASGGTFSTSSITTIEWAGANLILQNSYTTVASTTNTAIASATRIAVGNSYYNSYSMQWARLRTISPTGVMPSVTQQGFS
jgi:hypothetical protein